MGLSQAEAQFEEIYVRAEAAGKAAVDAIPDPDHFGCGFAWVEVSGNTKFGRWAKREKGWSKGSPTGMCLAITGYGQNENAKYAYACAFASVLRDAGIDAHAQSRSD